MNSTLAAETSTEPLPHEDDPLLTLSEVARIVGKTRGCVHRWALDGLLEYVRMPSGIVHVRRSVVNRFLGGTALATRKA